MRNINEPFYVTLSELAEEIKVPKSNLYERSRKDRIPGLVRIGRLIRIDIRKFRAGLEEGELE